MKKWISAGLMSLLATVGFSQEHWCGFDQYNEAQRASDDAYRLNEENFVKNVHEKVAHFANRDGEKIIVPTVVHVTYSDCESNISKSQIEDALRVLNEDYARTNADTSETRSVFSSFADAGNIEFRLAQVDPDGNPTDGITRSQTSAAIDAQNNIKDVVYWNSSEYFNIWVVESIYPFTGGTGIILGYAQFPGNGSWNDYGIVIRNDAMGTIGTSTADGRTLTHEVGHCLGLYHTFQSGCGGNCSTSGDRLCDTPPAEEATYNCSSSTNTCSNDAVGASVYSSDVPDQIENYMSYNSCQNMFTEDQMTVARASFSQYSTLQNLVSQSNLEATGVVGIVSADFSLDVPVICEGTQVPFVQSSSYDAETFDWSFGPNAVPGTSTDETPIVAFWEEGLQTVDYTMAIGNDSETGSKPVFVVSKTGQYAPFQDGFENVSSVNNDDWFAVNPDDDDTYWSLTSSIGFNSNKSLMVNNSGQCGQRYEELYSQSYDLSTFSAVTVQFKTAYAQTTTDNADILRVYVSTDCGRNWQLVWVRSGSTLAGSVSPTTGSYIPAGNSDWQANSFSLLGTRLTEGVLFKFEFMSDGGNNLYLDDFDISGTFSGEQLLLSPENGKQGLATDVLIDWKSAGAVSGYEYEVDTDASFSSANKISGTTNFIGIASDLADTEMELSGLSTNTMYFWRVRNQTSGSYSDWSNIWTFTISESGVGIDENAEATTFSLYPNPANDVVTIEGAEGMHEIQLIDYTGRIISTHQLNNERMKSLNISDFKAGVYFIVITTQNQERVVESLVIN